MEKVNAVYSTLYIYMYKAERHLAMRDVDPRKKCTPLWREAGFSIKNVKTGPSHFWEGDSKSARRCGAKRFGSKNGSFGHRAGSGKIKKVHAVVARSTCWNVKMFKTPMSDDFWKFRCGKSARRCGAKHIWKSKCTKHVGLGPLLEVEMWKKCTPLWRQAHLEVNNVQNTTVSEPLLGVHMLEKVHAVVARSTF